MNIPDRKITEQADSEVLEIYNAVKHFFAILVELGDAVALDQSITRWIQVSPEVKQRLNTNTSFVEIALMKMPGVTMAVLLEELLAMDLNYNPIVINIFLRSLLERMHRDGKLAPGFHAPAYNTEITDLGGYLGELLIALNEKVKTGPYSAFKETVVSFLVYASTDYRILRYIASQVGNVQYELVENDATQTHYRPLPVDMLRSE
jgi:hypothetical protein